MIKGFYNPALTPMRKKGLKLNRFTFGYYKKIPITYTKQVQKPKKTPCKQSKL